MNIEEKILTANKIKTIAIIVMFLDHFASVFLPHTNLISLIFRLLGRTAAPVFCFFIAEGYHYTSNLKKYIARLFIFAAVSHLPYNLAFGFSFFRATSVIWPLAIGLAALAAIKSEKIHFILKPVILAACCLIAYPFRANWHFIAVLWIVVFGVFHGNFKRQIAGFLTVGVVCHIIPSLIRFGFFHEAYPQWHQLGIFLAVPLLAMYNGKPGKKSLAMKWLFYVFYPAHLILLYLLSRFTPLADVIKELLHLG